MEENQAITEFLQQTFFRNYSGRIQDAKMKGINFIHYTTADTLVRILESKTVYLRNTRVLNDPSEIKFGYAFLSSCAFSSAGTALFEAINKIDKSLNREVLLGEFFDRIHYPNIARNTYVFSMSEYVDQPTSRLGVLSMWRAYGGNAGVAIVIDAEKTAFTDSDAAGAWTFPVEYVECSELGHFPANNWLCSEFQHIAEQINANQEFLRKVESRRIIGPLMQLFYLAILRSKHAAFKEEQEWRVIRTQGHIDAVNAGPSSVETIGGIPQQVFKLSLKEHLDGKTNPLNLELSNILKLVLIGPCDHAEVIRDAVISKLTEIGVRHSGAKVIVTNIPYRPNQR